MVEMCDLQCVCQTVAAGATGLRSRPAVQLRVNLRHKHQALRDQYGVKNNYLLFYI